MKWIILALVLSIILVSCGISQIQAEKLATDEMKNHAIFTTKNGSLDNSTIEYNILNTFKQGSLWNVDMEILAEQLDGESKSANLRTTIDKKGKIIGINKI